MLRGVWDVYGGECALDVCGGEWDVYMEGHSDVCGGAVGCVEGSMRCVEGAVDVWSGGHVECQMICVWRGCGSVEGSMGCVKGTVDVWSGGHVECQMCAEGLWDVWRGVWDVWRGLWMCGVECQMCVEGLWDVWRGVWDV